MKVRHVAMLSLFGLGACGTFGSAGGDNPASNDESTLPPPVTKPGDEELTEAFGVFVTATGSSDGDGSRAKPLQSIAAAVTRAKDAKLRVYVCAGVYKEAITLVSGVSLMGSLGCDGGVWASSESRARIEAPSSPAIVARDIDVATTFDGFDVLSPVGTPHAPSSIALLAERAGKLVVNHSRLTASKGASGVDGADGVMLTLGASARGKDGLPSVASFAPVFTKPSPPNFPIPKFTDLVLTPLNVSSRPGQAGGVGSCVGAPGHDGTNGGAGGRGATNVCTERTINVGGSTVVLREWTPSGTSTASNALPMSNAAGAPGSDGASATAIGVFSSTGYAPADGADGTDGLPGNGGAGGNGMASAYPSGATCDTGNYSYGAAGPGGGAGGCPGLAGKAGTGGGASVAALLFDSGGLTFTLSELTASDGGNGGHGTFGSEPTMGGQPGSPMSGSPPAAAGGAGGRAGISGNGAGGPSYGVAYEGGEPRLAPSTTAVVGNGGKGVAAQTHTSALGDVLTLPASPDGPSKSVVEL